MGAWVIIVYENKSTTLFWNATILDELFFNEIPKSRKITSLISAYHRKTAGDIRLIVAIAIEQTAEAARHTCRECAHSYNWSGKAYDGSLFLCRCPYDERKQYGKYYKFLSDKACGRFEMRVSNGEEEA